MANVARFGSYVILTLSPFEKLISMHSSPRAKYSEILSVKRVEKPWKRRALRGVPFPGLPLSFLLSLGTWRVKRGKKFVALYGRRPGYTVTFLSGEYMQWIFTPKNSRNEFEAIFEDFLVKPELKA